jgi:cytochrome c oxidase subunit II
VPNLAGKRDMIPNQDNQVWFSADEPGVYYGQCAELCLGAHAYMRFRVIAVDEADYASWVDAFQRGAELTQAAAGRPARRAGSRSSWPRRAASAATPSTASTPA